MQKKQTAGGGTVAAFLLFLIGIAGVLLTGTTALVIWLAGWIGVIYAALVVCALFLVMALCCYLFSLRKIIRKIGGRLKTVADVANLIEQGYDWVIRQFSLAVGLFQRALEQLEQTKKEPAE